MKKLCFISAFILAASSVFGQQMQEFNQLYFENEYKNKVIKATNAVKAFGGAAAAAAAAAALAPSATPAADAEAMKEATTPDPLIEDNINEASVLPAFTDLLGNDILLPKIEINGVTNFNSEKLGLYGDIKLFTSALSAKKVSYSKVFFPEASTYGISMSLNYLPKWAENKYKNAKGDLEEAKWFCAYFNLHYGGKNLYGIDSDNGASDTVKFTSDIAHTKIGIQIIPIKNLLSFYVDYNSLLALTGRESLKTYSASLSNGFTNFVNVGTRFLLAKAQDKPLNLFVDFSAVIMSHTLKKTFPTDDKIIPRISIGGAARF